MHACLLLLLLLLIADFGFGSLGGILLGHLRHKKNSVLIVLTVMGCMMEAALTLLGHRKGDSFDFLVDFIIRDLSAACLLHVRSVSRRREGVWVRIILL